MGVVLLPGNPHAAMPRRGRRSVGPGGGFSPPRFQRHPTRPRSSPPERTLPLPQHKREAAGNDPWPPLWLKSAKADFGDFYRDETSSCSMQVIFGDFGIARDLPAFKSTAVEFTPNKAGEFTWTCGMSMLCDELVVEQLEQLRVLYSERIRDGACVC